MHEENEIKSKILKRAFEVFTQFGFSRVTMEEIATGLCISKKTLYKFFNNKEHLVKEVIENEKCDVTVNVDAILDDGSLDFLAKLEKLLSYVGSQSGRFHGPMMADLMRAHPEIWNDIKEFRRQRTTEKLSKLFSEGVEQGLIRSDVNIEIVTVMYVSTMHYLIDPDTILNIKLTPEVVMSEMIKILFEGVLTDSGRSRYSQIKF